MKSTKSVQVTAAIASGAAGLLLALMASAPPAGADPVVPGAPLPIPAPEVVVPAPAVVAPAPAVPVVAPAPGPSAVAAPAPDALVATPAPAAVAPDATAQTSGPLAAPVPVVAPLPGDPAVLPPDPAAAPPAAVPHLASPDALPPGSTMDPSVLAGESPNVGYLKDLWHAVQNQEISGKEALLLGVAQRGMNTPYPNQAPGPNVPLTPSDAALAPPPADPAPALPAPGPVAPTP